MGTRLKVLIAISIIAIVAAAVIVFVCWSEDAVCANVSDENPQLFEFGKVGSDFPLDVRDKVLRVLDVGIPYAERNAALIAIRYTFNANEVAALEKCILGYRGSGPVEYVVLNMSLSLSRHLI